MLAGLEPFMAAVGAMFVLVVARGVLARITGL